MSIKNKYVKRAKISEAKFRQLIRYFAHDFDANTIASLCRLNRNTINRYLALIRKRIAEFCDQKSVLNERVTGIILTPDGKTITGKTLSDAYKFLIQKGNGREKRLQRNLVEKDVDSFLTFAYDRFSKFNGISEATFYFHIKECEFRFFNRDKDLYKLLLKMFRNAPLS